MPGPHFIVPNLSFNFYAFFLYLAVLTGEIYLFRSLKSVPKLGRILFALLSTLFTMSGVGLAVIVLPEQYFSASLCGAVGFMLCALLFDKFYNNPKVYKILDIKKPTKTPRYYFSKNCIIAAPLIYAIAKLGCTYAGCCHGFSYSGPFSLSYNNQSHGTFFPVQPLETLVFIGIFFFAYKNRKTFSVIAICTTAKFLLDFLRFGHDTALISPNQIACLLILIATIICYFLQHKKHITP